MAEDQFAGSARAFGGKVEESVGKVAGNAKHEMEEFKSQAADAIGDVYARTTEAAREGAESVKSAAVAGHDFLRKFMEDNPHTTTLIALGVGLLIGYAAHRQPPRRGWWS